MSIIRNVILSGLIGSGVAFAQNPPKAASGMSESSTLERDSMRSMAIGHVRAILGKYLQDHQYSVLVNFDMPAAAPVGTNVPYAPLSVMQDTWQSLPPAEALAKLSNVRITLLLPDYLDRATQETLRSLVQGELTSDKGPDIKVEAKTVKLNVQDPNKMSVQAANSAAVPPQASPAQERALQDAISKVKELQTEVEKLKQQKAAAPVEVSQTSNSKTNNWQEFLEFAKTNPLLVGVAVLLSYLGAFVILLVPFRLIAGALKGFGDAFGAIAKSIKSFSDSFSNRSPTGSDSASNPSVPVQGSALGGGAEIARPASRDIDPQKVRERVQQLRSTYSNDADNLSFEYVCSLLANVETISKAPIFLEVLEESAARRIFQRLSEDQKQAIISAMKNPRGGDKGATIMDLVDVFETKLAGKDWKGLTDGHLNRDVKNEIGALNDSELLQLAQDISEDGLRRLLLYLNPESIIGLLQAERSSKGKMLNIVGLVATMPEALLAQDSDKEILLRTRALASAKSADHYQVYLSNFVSIIENAGEGLDDQLIEALAGAKPEFGKRLRKHIMTVGSLFRLPDASRTEVLQSFSNYELGLLISAFPDETKKSAIYSTMDRRRRELVEEGVDNLQSEARNVLQDSQVRVKKKLIQALRQFAKSGSLPEDTDTSANSQRESLASESSGDTVKAA